MVPVNLSDDRWLLPEGIEEILPDEAAQLERLRRDVLDMFATWGYRLVVTPLIEFIESLLTGTGKDLNIQTFKLIDQISGRQLGIRADMTPQVARIDARSSGSDAPSRLCYLGTVLHTLSDRLEKSRSPMQVGAELYGHTGIASDLEVICLMLELLAISGIPQVHLDLGHVGIYRALAEDAGLDSSTESELFEILQRKAKPELRGWLEAQDAPVDAKERLAALVDLNGGVEILARAAKSLAGANERVAEALEALGQIANRLALRFPALPIHFDLAELRGYHYQTGVVFAAFTPTYGREIARGGRYDAIGQVFGRARPATGFSADLRVLLRLGSLDDPGDQCVGAIFAPAVEGPDLHDLVRSLRASGRTVIQELPGQSVSAAEMGCLEQLVRVDAEWRIAGVASSSRTASSRD